MSATIDTPPAVDAERAKLQAKADAQAAGLRQLADLLQAHPEIAHELSYSLGNISEPVDTREPIAVFAQAAAAAGAKVSKLFNDKYAGVDVRFGPVMVAMWASRDEVCERVVVGTETVTREVPDPEALAAVPTVTVTETVEQVEWRCRPLLADESTGADR